MFGLARSNKLKGQDSEQRKVYCKGQASSTGSGSGSKDPGHQLFLCWPWIRTLWLQRKLRDKNRESDPATPQEVKEEK